MTLDIKIHSSSSITLQQFMDYKGAKDDIERMIVATGMKRDKVLQLKPETINLAMAFFEDECKKTAPFLRRFRMTRNFKAKQFGVIPNFEQMSILEYITADRYSKEVFEQNVYTHYDELMAVFYRPVIRSFGQFYRVQKYKSNNTVYYIDYIRQLPIDRVNGLMAFFLTLREELMKSSLTSLSQL